ncbi:MAG: tetratricopeptide repeat protein [Alphaproteobacteria bacterium]|nr:tetratricopeptide repeat protein [Alphaproteobacteria bacterium]
MNLEAELQAGILAHSEGRLGDAARCYRRVLEADSNNADALHLMGVLSLMGGEAAFAESLARQAIAAAPDWFAPHVGLGNALQAQGRLEEAAACFQTAVSLHPQSAEAYSNLSSCLCALGRADQAADAAVNAIVIDGAMAEAHNNFGNALAALGSPSEAAEAYFKAIALKPDYSDAWYNLANAQMAAGELDEAVKLYRRAIELSPAPIKYYNLGNALLAAGRPAEAIDAFRTVLELDPGFVAAAVNLSSAYKDLERLDEAASILREYQVRAPDAPDLHWNLALVSLQAGQWADGWREYEWRWKMPTFAPFVRDLGRPLWQGEDLAGRSILVHAEQGFGDAIEFCRFLPLLADRGARVVFECRAGLTRLMSALDSRIEVVALGHPLPETDYYLPMMSLVHALGLSIDQVGRAGPYLSAPAGSADFSDIAGQAGLKVGIVWAGGESRRDNRVRSCRAIDMAPLAAIAECRLFSLQVGPQAGQAAELGDGVTDLSPRLADFADTAAAIAALDLVISVDTGVVHLAGAMAKPVWVLLSKPSNGFLWMQERSDSPWYPSARLFRQTQSGDWSELMERVEREIISRYLSARS